MFLRKMKTKGTYAWNQKRPIEISRTCHKERMPGNFETLQNILKVRGTEKNI